MGNPQRQSKWWINSASEQLESAIACLHKAIEINPALKSGVDVLEQQLSNTIDVLNVFSQIEEEE